MNTQSKSKLVSIIIPTYKGSNVLKRAIDSVLIQTYPSIEIIVVDDNSPESKERKDTEKIMSEYYSEKIIYIKHDKNKNGSAARNTGFSKSNGDYIMFLDDDDEFLSNKVSTQVTAMESVSSEWGVSYTSFLRKINGKLIAKSYEKRQGNLYIEELSRNFFIHAGSNLMIRRSVVEDMNGFDETFTRNQDIEFLSRILERYKILYVDYIGLTVHIGFRKKSFDYLKVTEDYLFKFKSRIDALNDRDKEYVMKLINLQVFRYFFISFMLRKATLMIINKKVKCVDALKYFIHLTCRRVRKRVYGFKG